ncbi:MAG: hypothetical protein QUV02_11995 [Maricaulis sp.]|jgi:sulfite exporter TauE/SafE|uniref:hypothetical protein n=1 Tax=Maricaulis sp. TaxID=1486257 RepID=UPI001B033D7C|nr:hypothetical protein [Maricaulis sp.]MBO6729699.1 hypothetical protein [Maricaulis sp.]MBO6847705.1 hypothetical protein [Maricaulis sp.]MBO6878476.1 hypothetical protein [Maricaulis sp.]MDM7985161.1 hypothetical protein [Maricaulis sp.]
MTSSQSLQRSGFDVNLAGVGLITILGALWALFAAGTLPAVLASAFGAAKLMSFAARPQMRVLTGLSIVSLGILSAALPWKAIAAFCGIPVE